MSTREPMNTELLSTRMRMMYIETASKNPGGIEGFDTNLYFEAIKAAELLEAGEHKEGETDNLLVEQVITLVRSSDAWKTLRKVVMDLDEYESELHDRLTSAISSGYIFPSTEARDKVIEAAEYLRDYSRTTSPELVAKYAEDILAAIR